VGIRPLFLLGAGHRGIKREKRTVVRKTQDHAPAAGDTRKGASGRTLDSGLVAEIEAVAAGAGCELAHAELKGNILRLFIDREPGGVTLADCEHVSRQVSALLDVADYGTGRYVLEVSSPGLDRELYGPRDYARFTGRLARVTFEEPRPDGAGARKRTVVGRLREFREGGASGGEIEVVDEKTGEALTLPLDDVKTARLEIEL
jgi:ribosome maturation factor RimP